MHIIIFHVASTFTGFDSALDDETEDDSRMSGASSVFGSFRRGTKLKKGRLTKASAGGDYLLEQRFKRGTDFFQATESVNLLQFSRPKKGRERMLQMMEGIDDGTYCVNYSKRDISKLLES